ncbi:MAG: protein kinase [Gammaproteobacteria bacterium]|nr:MAG: protein kinase [Gammaproteobacteria bacterium]
MSLLKELKITEDLMAKYSPLSQLSRKYLSQVLKGSRVLTFEPGEVVFNKSHSLDFVYYLLHGKLKVKKGFFSSQTLDAGSPDCLNSINGRVPDGVAVKAMEKGHMLLVDEKFLDRALGWSEVEQDKISSTQQMAAGTSDTTNAAADTALASEKEEFDEDHFTWITSLMEFPLFFNLPPSNMEMLLNKFSKVEVSKDQVIVQEGDEGDYFYLLMQGSARVIIGGDESRPIRLNSGSYFGEEALISNTVRSATVIMNEDGLLARLDKESFQSLLNDPLVKHVTKSEYLSETADGAARFELLDIRSFSEFEFAPLPQCLHVPLSDLRQRIPTLDKTKVYYLTEEGGQRSEVAAHILCQNSIQAKVIGEKAVSA